MRDLAARASGAARRTALAAAIVLGLAALPAVAAFDEPPVEQKLVPMDRLGGDQFGRAVAVDGPHLVIGSPDNDEVESGAGKAHVFERTGGVWYEVDELFAPDGEISNGFGTAVGIDQDWLVVGAPRARKDPGTPTAGAAYVFERSFGGSWDFAQKLIADDGANDDRFGFAVAIDGDTIVVGAHARQGARGAVYVFVRDAFDDWNEQDVLEDPNGAPEDHLGISVDIDGDQVVAGAYRDIVQTPAGSREKGSVSVFTRQDGVWSYDQKVFSPGDSQYIEYGWSVGLDSGELAVGAPADTPPFLPGQTIRSTGTVYRYDATAADIASTQVRVFPSDRAVVGGPQDFGWALGLHENVLAVGTPGDGSVGVSAGSVYLFDLEDGLLTESRKVTASDTAAGDGLGTSVAVSRWTVLAGAPGDEAESGDNAGAAYVFRLPEPGAHASAAAALGVLSLLARRRRRGAAASSARRDRVGTPHV